MQPKLTVGKHKITGEPVYIETSANGLKCEAICVTCLRDLEARQGKVNDWTFAHDSADPQLPGYNPYRETLLHFISKWIIKKGTRIKLPGEKYFEYTDAFIERLVDRFRIDVYLFNALKNETLLVEVFVCHDLELEKVKALTDLEYKVLEIDLSRYHGSLAQADMEALLLETTYKKTLHKRRFPAVMYGKFEPLVSFASCLFPPHEEILILSSAPSSYPLLDLCPTVTKIPTYKNRIRRSITGLLIPLLYATTAYTAPTIRDLKKALVPGASPFKDRLGRNVLRRPSNKNCCKERTSQKKCNQTKLLSASTSII